MPAFNDWNVPYVMIKFFSNALDGHKKVASYKRTKDIYFTITLTNAATLNVLLVNEYSLGLAAVLRAKAEFPDVEYIVTGGNWNGYTPQAKEYGWQNSIGIFDPGEFFGALNWAEPKKYYRKDEDGNPVYSYKPPSVVDSVLSIIKKKKMKMEILSIVTRVPRHSEVYVFGSILSTASANDFDLLVIYDENECPAHEAYVRHANLCAELQTAFALPIHLTVLTRSEAKDASFIERTNAVPLEVALRVLLQRLSTE